MIDETFTLGSPNGSFFPLSDALASTTTLTDGGGSAITQYTYAPFGVTAVSQAGSSSTFNSPAVKMTDR